MESITKKREVSKARIGSRAPRFRAVTTKGSVYFPGDYCGKWVILFFHPTVPSESDVYGFVALSSSQYEFEELLISNPNREILKQSGLIQHKSCNFDSATIAYIIDPDAIIRAMVDYDQSQVPDMELFKNLIISLQTTNHFPVNVSVYDTPENLLQTSLTESLEDLESGVINSDKKYQLCDCFYCAST